MTAIVLKYTDKEIDDIICLTNKLYVYLCNKFTSSKLYYLQCSEKNLMTEVFLYRWVLDNWDNSSLDNKISLEELTTIIDRLKDLSNCNC